MALPVDLGAPSVGLGDGANNCQAESGAAPRAGGVAAGEAVEGVVGDGAIEALPRVRDLQLDAARDRPRAQDNLAITVAECVVNQVPERLAQPQRIRAQLQVALALDFDPDRAATFGGTVDEPVSHPAEELACPDHLRAHRQLAVRSSRDHQEVLGERGEAVALFDRFGHRLAGLRAEETWEVEGRWFVALRRS